MRRFMMALAMVFLGNSVAVAAHACFAQATGQQPAAVVQHEGCVHDEQAPAGSEDVLCAAHCVQGDKATQHKFAGDVSAAVAAPVLHALYPALEPRTPAAVLAFAVPIVGPPLTILLHNLRN